MNGEWRKKAVLLWGAGALLGMIAGGARAEAPTVRVDQVVAYVNEHAITDGCWIPNRCSNGAGN